MGFFLSHIFHFVFVCYSFSSWFSVLLECEMPSSLRFWLRFCFRSTLSATDYIINYFMEFMKCGENEWECVCEGAEDDLTFDLAGCEFNLISLPKMSQFYCDLLMCIPFTRTHSEFIRGTMAISLGKMRDAEYRGECERAIERTTEWVRKRCRWALHISIYEICGNTLHISSPKRNSRIINFNNMLRFFAQCKTRDDDTHDACDSNRICRASV